MLFDAIYIDIDIQRDADVLAWLVAGVKKLKGWMIDPNVLMNSVHRIYRFGLESRRFSWWGDNGNTDIQVVTNVEQVADILTFIRERGDSFIGIEVPAALPNLQHIIYSNSLLEEYNSKYDTYVYKPTPTPQINPQEPWYYTKNTKTSIIGEIISEYIDTIEAYYNAPKNI